MAEDSAETPRGDLAYRTMAMPADTNPNGDIFGGWIMGLMDLAGGMSARQVAQGRAVTASVGHLNFLHPVKVGDAVCCYTKLLRQGRTSFTFAIETWVVRGGYGKRFKVTAAEFTFVAVDAAGRPRPLQPLPALDAAP
ncbi:MAG: acyl-CoA thioesterase [Acetobacteraceae bacterium]|nr:acyl-CoA thioesterase [Acetobacteraceae bacterium]